MRLSMYFVSFVLGLFCCTDAVFALAPMHTPDRTPDRMVQVVQHIPSRQELIRLQGAGVEFLFCQLAAYPDRFQAKDLADYQGHLTMVISAPTAPDSLQSIALNELKGPVWLFVAHMPDVYGCNRLAELKNDVKIYVSTTAYPGSMDLQNLARIQRGLSLVINANYPDSIAADRVNDMAQNVKLTLNLAAYPDQWTVRNTNKITRPTTLFINKTSSPGSSTEAGYLAMLNTNFAVFIGRSFSAQMVLDRLLAALVSR